MVAYAVCPCFLDESDDAAGGSLLKTRKTERADLCLCAVFFAWPDPPQTSWAWCFEICSRPFHFGPVIVAGLGITISWGIRNMIQIKKCQCPAWDIWIKLTSYNYNTATLEPMLPVQNGWLIQLTTLRWTGTWHWDGLKLTELPTILLVVAPPL